MMMMMMAIGESVLCLRDEQKGKPNQTGGILAQIFTAWYLISQTFNTIANVVCCAIQAILS